MLKSLREFIGGPLGWLASAVGLVITLLAVIKFVHHSRTAWMWLFFAAIALLVFAIWRFHQMRKDRDNAAQTAATVTQTLVNLEDGASFPGSISAHQVSQTIGPADAPVRAHRVKRRWLARTLTEEQRVNLASRCVECSQQALVFLHRPEPARPWPFDHQPYELQVQTHRAQTEQTFTSEFVPRIRDLLNEWLRRAMR